MRPINYISDVQSPFQSSMQGIQNALALANAIDYGKAQQQKEQQLALATQQAQEQRAQQQQMQSDMSDLAKKENPTAQDFSRMVIKYPQLSDHYKAAWNMVAPEQQQARLTQASQIFSALSANKPDIALNLTKEYAAAHRNSGDEEGAKNLETLANIMQQSPENAKASTGLLLSSVMGPDKFNETFSTLSKTPEEVKNIESQIKERSARLSLDKDKLMTDTQMKLAEMQQTAAKLPESAIKLINDSTVDSVSRNQASGQMIDLANRIDATGGGYGAFSTAAEWLKGATGNQDYMTNLRNEYVRVKNGEALKMLPPGSASDKDVQLAMRGFPPDSADSATMSSFLRGMAKLNQFQATADEAKAEWVNSVGHLGKPKADIEVAGIKVPAGTTFATFASEKLKGLTEQKSADQQKADINSRPYMKYAGK